MQGNREWEWKGMLMSIWENNGNWNRCLAGVGMRLKLMGIGRNSRTPLL